MKSGRIVLWALLGLSLVVGDVSAQSAIMEHFELVRDAATLTWIDLDGNAADLGAAAGPVAIVQGEKVGGVNGTPFRRGELVFEESKRAPSLDISTAVLPDYNSRGIRGVWENRLPLAKHLQAEVIYDIFCDENGIEDPVDVALLVQQRNARTGGEWETVAKFNTETIKEWWKADVSSARRVAGETYKTHVFIADLTPYAGEYVRLVFESSFSHPGSRGYTGCGGFRAGW